MADRVSAINFFNQAASIPNPANYTGNPQLKYQLFASAVMADPTMAMGVYELANANREMGLLHSAIALYRRLLELPVTDTPGELTLDIKSRALTNMGHSLYTLGMYDEADRATRLAIEINPKLSMAWCNLSLVESVLGFLTASVESAKTAHALEPDNAVAEVSLAFAHFYSGDFMSGLKHFEARFPYRFPHFMNYPYPKWEGEEGKTIFLVSEQGVGDALSFSRFIEMAAQRSAFIHIVVQKELVRLFKVSFQHLRNVNIMGSPQPFVPADYWTTFMSLPRAMGLTNEKFLLTPNIKIPKFQVNTGVWKCPDRKFHIGVAWSGSPASDINHWRSFPVTQLLELCKIPDVQLYSIQLNDQTKELHNTGCSVVIRDLSPFITDVADTIGIMDHLDLIVTTESAPGHIAGHAGVDTLIPYSYAGRDWRVGPKGGVPIWYPKSLAIQQKPDMRWEPVFEEINRLVRQKVEERWPK